jgi:uncharacterized iron-regulated protein
MRNFSLLLPALLLFLLSACSRPAVTPPRHTLPQGCAVYDMKQAACIGEEELVSRLAPYRVVFAGDHHASAAMHKALAGLLASLGKSGRRVMLANEWFTPADDALLSQYAQGRFDGNFTEAIGWRKKAGYPFKSYAPLYQSVKSVGGTLYGINMDKAFQKALSDNNLTGLSAAQRRFDEALDMNLTAHRALLSPFFAHCHARRAGEDDQSCSQRMYRVQVAWDTYMAQQSADLADKLLKEERDLLVVFAGAMHLAYGVGINARFARRSREPFVTILPVAAGTQNADVGEADYLLFYTPETPGKGTP